MAASMY